MESGDLFEGGSNCFVPRASHLSFTDPPPPPQPVPREVSRHGHDGGGRLVGVGHGFVIYHVCVKQIEKLSSCLILWTWSSFAHNHSAKTVVMHPFKE